MRSTVWSYTSRITTGERRGTGRFEIENPNCCQEECGKRRFGLNRINPDTAQAAGVSLETRKVLLGHTNGDITSHYLAPELEELFKAASKVCETKSGKTSAITLLRRRTPQAA